MRPKLITYEFPLNERVRALLRLEDAMGKYLFFASAHTAIEHQAAIAGLFDMVEIAGRVDLKVDLLQELERQRQTLQSFRDNPAISLEILDSTLEQIALASSALLTISGKLGQHIRDNEWLSSVRNRVSIPGGSCQFDLPAYHYWLQQPSEARKANLQSWFEPMLPIKNALSIVLHLLRASGKAKRAKTQNGIFQTSLTSQSVQMVRVGLEKGHTPIVPEVSANKYAINIRFLESVLNMRPIKLEDEVSFELCFCSL